MGLVSSQTTEYESRMMNADVTIVIPFLNEEKNLPSLLDNLDSQSTQPKEIIFVDAGSEDAGASLIEQWSHSKRKSGAKILLLSSPGAYPGKARNVGVQNAVTTWIAFLDVGVTPQRDWLEESIKYVTEKKKLAGFGVCHFFSNGNYVSKVLCALSYGYGTTAPVLPGSIFHKNLFEEVGFFREDLRASEDVLWIRDCVSFLGKRPVSEKSVVSYASFPASISRAMYKWYLYAKASSRSRFNLKQQFVYVSFFSLLTILIFLDLGNTAVSCFVLYAMLRGILLTLWRNNFSWIKKNPHVLLGCLWVAPLLDLSKTTGFISGYVEQIRDGFKLSAGFFRPRSSGFNLSNVNNRIQKKKDP